MNLQRLTIRFLLIGMLLSLTNSSGSYSVTAQNKGAAEHVSIASEGILGNGSSSGASISADGRFVAFQSDANNLVPGDTNDVPDVFVHDRQTGQTTRVSVASDGTQGNAGSWQQSISEDGRFVAFQSGASNLVPGDTRFQNNVFVYDRQTGETTRVSVASDGTKGNAGSTAPSISIDGRFVAFQSDANNLVPGDTNGHRDVFVHDRQSGETTRVSVASSGAQGNSSSWGPSISAGGRFVVFESFANNLVPGDTNSFQDIFVHDRQSGETTRVSVASSGAQANSSSTLPSISEDGRFVTFETSASNLVPGDFSHVDVFVHDRQTGQTTLVSVASDGTQANSSSWGPSISAGGRFVAFQSFANNLVPGDTNGHVDVFVHDRQTGETTRVSVASDGTQSSSYSAWPSISRDGRFVEFESFADNLDNLVAGDTNGFLNIFVHDRQTGQTTLVSISSGVGQFFQSISGQVTDGNKPLPNIQIAIDGVFATSTDDTGTYVINGLAPGTYTITPILFRQLATQVVVPPSTTVDFVLSDQDGDGLYDIWEMYDTDLDGDGTIDIGPSMGSNPLKKDIYVQVDWMVDLKQSQRPYDDAIRKIVEAFADVPAELAQNPDGTKGINLHVDVGPESIDYVTGEVWGDRGRGHGIPFREWLGLGSSLREAVISLLTDGRPRQSDRVFHYAFFVHQFVDLDGRPSCWSGVSLGNQVFLVSLGCTIDGKGSINEQAGTFMHELGHNLGLQHGGNETGDEDPDTKEQLFNHKPNYLSVMNYSFQKGGLVKRDANGKLMDGYFDYSRFELPDLDETSLSQHRGLNAPEVDIYGTKHYCSGPIKGAANPTLFIAPANGPIDWDCNLATINDITQYDVNNAGGNTQRLKSFRDWDHLQYTGIHSNIGRGDNPPPLSITPEMVAEAHPELTPEEDLKYQRISEPRVQLFKTVSPDITYPGETVTYEITLLNTDASDVEGVTVTDTLPPGFSYQAGSTNGATSNDPVVAGHNLTWGPFVVPADRGSLTLSFQVTVASVPGTYSNSVFGSSTNGFVLPISETASVEVQEAANLADLSLTKTANQDPVTVGQNLTYNLTVINHGPSDAAGVTVADTLPAGVTFFSASPTQGNCADEAGGIITCNLGTLANGANATATIVVAPMTAGTIVNTAIVTSDTPDPNTDNNSGNAQTTVNEGVVPVAIDIQPGGSPNSINCNNRKGEIPVAILTTDTFDARTVDHTTVIFEGAREIHVDKKTGRPIRHEEDVDGDGDLDLVFHFRLGDTALTCSSTQAILTGSTFAGLPIQGTDSVRTISGTARSLEADTVFLPLVGNE